MFHRFCLVDHLIKLSCDTHLFLIYFVSIVVNRDLLGWASVTHTRWRAERSMLSFQFFVNLAFVKTSRGV